MLRRQARQRREYIYRKSVENKERKIQEKKEQLKRAIDGNKVVFKDTVDLTHDKSLDVLKLGEVVENKQIPHELQGDAIDLEKTLAWDAKGVDSQLDDEYRWAGVEDPKIIVTTSREPGSRLKMFAKEIKLVFPNSQRINRGNYEMKHLIDACRANNVTDLIIVNEHRGTPDGLVVCHFPYGPTAYFNLSNVVMRHDIPDVGTMSEQFPHLIFNNFSTRLGKRVQDILKYLFPVPKEDSKRVMTFSNDDDYISFRHHIYKKTDGGKNIDLTEVGPRFEMKLYKIILGTLENESVADVEWVYRPYMNTAKKRKFLSTDYGD